MRTIEERNKVMELHAQGMNNSQISKFTGIPRGTVTDIVKCKFTKLAGKIPEKFNPIHFTEKQREAYSYMLGQYLGDGCIDLCKKGVWRLRIASDCKYPNIIQEIKDKMKIILPKNIPLSNVKKINNKPSCDSVTVYSKKLFDMFPQHGNGGKKHDRKIVLLDWQQSIIDNYSKEFLRGLIHSDGSRFFVTRERAYKYQFTNCSEDILNLCRYCLDLLKINHYTCERAITGKMKRKSYNIFMSNKEDVLFLDSFIGAKT